MDRENSETGTRDPMLDGWRGLAILGVLFDHFITSQGINVGRFGVELFFVLSGRLMAEILFVRRTPLPHFFSRRVSRIYPTLFVFATVIVLISELIYNLDVSPRAYLSAVTLTANYVSVFWQRTYDYDHLWSLCIEEHMYILLAIVAAFTRWKSVPPLWIIMGLAAVAIVTGAVQTWGWHFNYKQAYWRSDVRGASILIGAAIYLLLRDPSVRPEWLNRSAASIVCVGVAIALNINAVPDPIKYSLGTVSLAIGLMTLKTSAPWWRALFQSRVLMAVGMVSYSIYIWQEPFGEIDDRMVRLASLPIAILCGLASFHFIEQPGRRALNRRLHPGPRPAAAGFSTPGPG